MSKSTRYRGRVVVLATNTVIQAFGDHAKDVLFTNQSVRDWQISACASAKFEFTEAGNVEEAFALLSEITDQPRVLMLDRHYITEKALKDFIKAARNTTNELSRLAFSVNCSVDYTRPLQSVNQEADLVEHDIFLFRESPRAPSGDDLEAWLTTLRAQATSVEVPKREIVFDIPLPTIGEGKRNYLKYPITSTIVVSVEHWVHVLWLNQLAFGIWLAEALRKRPLWILWRAITAFSFNIEVILSRFVQRARTAKIHPTAYVSGSVIEAGAYIGPHATVRNSYIGAGAHIQDHAVILNSVVGENNLIIENTFLVSSMSYPDATVGNYKLQLSLLGRGSYINAWAGFVDAKFIGSIKVEHKGELVSTERSFLGSVVGHRAKIAAKVLIHPGREVPNDTVVVMRPDEVISVIPDKIEPQVPMVRDQGTLVPLGQEKRAK